MASVSGRIRDSEFQSQGLDNLQDLSDLAGWLTLLNVTNEAEACTTGHRQILLGDLQFFTPCANHGTKLLWSSSIHITDREDTVLGSACQKENITDRERFTPYKPFEYIYYRSGRFLTRNFTRDGARRPQVSRFQSLAFPVWRTLSISDN